MVDDPRDSKMIKLKNPHTHSSLWQRIYTHRLILLIAVGAIFIAGYILWSKHIWDDYEVKARNWQENVHVQVDKALALPVTSEKERNDKFTALKHVSDTIISSKATLCSVNGLVGWQRAIQTLHAREERCQKEMSATVTFNEKIQAVVVYLKDEQSLAKIMSTLTGKPEVTENDLEAQETLWHDGSGKVEKLSVSTAFAPTKQAALDATKKIDTAWQGVLAAHKAKDQTKYASAQSQLATAYDSLNGVVDTNTKQLKALLDPLQSVYEKAFK
jgi:hypothetical protein